MLLKAGIEIFKVLSRIGVKPKDVIGMGGDIVKMGKSLFNTRVNPKLLEYIAKNEKIPAKILENIKIHARTLKNTTENQQKLFLENIKSIQKAKTPKIPVKSPSPVTSVQRPATSVKDAAEAFKGWTPKVIKGGKDGLATGGIANHFRVRSKFKPGGIVEPGVGYYARKSPTKINEELFTKIDDLIAEAGRAGQVLGKKGLGEGLGYKVVEKGKTSGQGGLNKVIKAWEKARDKTFTFKPAKFTANSPKVKQVIELFENGMSKKAIEFKTGISRKEIRSIFHQFAPEYIGDANLPSGEGRWAVQKRRKKIIKELTDYWKNKRGGKQILEEMNQKLRSIKLKNAEILKMSDEAILNNKVFREAMNLDVKGLRAGEGINFNRYKHLTDAEYIAKVKALAATNQFFQPEHFIAINKKNPASMLPKNIYTAVGKTGGQLEVLKNFVLTNPDDVRTKDINNFLKNQNLLEKKSAVNKAFNLVKSVTKPVVKQTAKRASAKLLYPAMIANELLFGRKFDEVYGFPLTVSRDVEQINELADMAKEKFNYFDGGIANHFRRK